MKRELTNEEKNLVALLTFLRDKYRKAATNPELTVISDMTDLANETQEEVLRTYGMSALRDHLVATALDTTIGAIEARMHDEYAKTFN